jgi:hypothetical protein
MSSGAHPPKYAGNEAVLIEHRQPAFGQLGFSEAIQSPIAMQEHVVP